MLEARREPTPTVAATADGISADWTHRRRRIRLARLLGCRRCCRWRSLASADVPRETRRILGIRQDDLVDVATVRTADDGAHYYTMPNATIAASHPA